MHTRNIRIGQNRVIGCLGALATLLVGCHGLPAPQPEVRLVLLGDSLTGTYELSTYPQYLITELALTEDQCAAEGQGGRTAQDGLEQLELLIEHAIYPNNQVLLYFLGGAEVIDFVGSRDPGLAIAPSDPEYPFTEELQQLLEDIDLAVRTALEHALQQSWTVHLVTYPDLPSDVEPCAAFGGNVLELIEAERANEYIELLNEILLDAGSEFDITAVRLDEVSAQLHDNTDNYSDCIHTSESGAQIFATTIADVLAQSL